MQHDLTTALAIYGAIISTIALVWQLFRWQMEKPQIKVKATHIDRQFDPDDSPGYIQFEIRNRGRSPTTIEEINFVDYDHFWLCLIRSPNQIENLSAYHKDTIQLPFVIQPGSVWKGDCPDDPERGRLHLTLSRRERFLKHRLYYRVRCAHKDRAISGKVKPEAAFERL